MKKYAILIFLVVVLSVAIIIKYQTAADTETDTNTTVSTVTINDHTLQVVVARTRQTQARGLGGRTTLNDTEGMLFEFDDYSTRSFWMKDMLLPIDIIWISDAEIIGFHDNVQPEPGVADVDLAVYTSPKPVNYVLEVRSGLRAEHNWTVGTKVQYSLDTWK